MVLIAWRLIIDGKVQGVGYRAWTVETARRFGLVGWVRNRADGSVEVLVQGTEAAIDRFVAEAGTGPPAAKVDGIEIRNEPVSDMRDFEKRPTL